MMISKQKHRSVRLPPQLESKVDEAIERTGLSLSHLIRQALLEKFERDNNPIQSVTPMKNSTEITVTVEEVYDNQMKASLKLNPFAYKIEGFTILTSEILDSAKAGIEWVAQILRAYREQGTSRNVKVTVTKPTDYLGDIFLLNETALSRHRLLSGMGEGNSEINAIAAQILSRCKDSV